MQNRANRILRVLREAYPGARTRLKYKNDYELLVAAILSAQTTDDQVNKVTTELFRRYPAPGDLAGADPEDIEGLIKSLGLFRTKSTNIVATCRAIVDKHGGRVPARHEDLVALPGVGRKVANVVLSNLFGEDVIAVDTHVFRVTNRLGLACARNPLETEKQLMEVLPPGTRGEAHHLFIYHGRELCRAKKPRCEECPVKGYCEWQNAKKPGH